jgi:hypothetical protein
MKRTSLNLFCLLLLVCVIPDLAQAQISLSPTAVFIHDQNNVGTLYVNNTSQEPQEVTVSLEFSYPGSDSQGNMVTISNDSVNAARFDFTGNMKVFPRQFVLRPGKKQAVRLQVKPMPSKPEGVYWGRIIVSSNAVSKDVEAVKVTEGMVAKINYVFKQNIPAFYIKGKVSTGLTQGKVITSVENGKLVAIVQLTPTGNSPFNGSVTARLTDSAGKEVASQQQTLVAYFEVLRRIELTNLPQGLPHGNYTLELTYETKRTDISSADLAQSPPLKKSVAVEIR